MIDRARAVSTISSSYSCLKPRKNVAESFNVTLVMPRVPLRSSPTAQVPFSMFNLTYYQSYFDVDTKTVLQRCLSSFIPKDSFVEDVCGSRVDLYGESRVGRFFSRSTYTCS